MQPNVLFTLHLVIALFLMVRQFFMGRERYEKFMSFGLRDMERDTIESLLYVILLVFHTGMDVTGSNCG